MKHIDNLWIDMEESVKREMLHNAVRYGWLKKEDIDDAVSREEEEEE